MGKKVFRWILSLILMTGLFGAGAPVKAEEEEEIIISFWNGEEGTDSGSTDFAVDVDHTLIIPEGQSIPSVDLGEKSNDGWYYQIAYPEGGYIETSVTNEELSNTVFNTSAVLYPYSVYEITCHYGEEDTDVFFTGMHQQCWVPSNPTPPENKSFYGWYYKDSSDNEVFVTSQTKYYADTDLYAKWVNEGIPVPLPEYLSPRVSLMDDQDVKTLRFEIDHGLEETSSFISAIRNKKGSFSITEEYIPYGSVSLSDTEVLDSLFPIIIEVPLPSGLTGNDTQLTLAVDGFEGVLTAITLPDYSESVEVPSGITFGPVSYENSILTAVINFTDLTDTQQLKYYNKIIQTTEERNNGYLDLQDKNHRHGSQDEGICIDFNQCSSISCDEDSITITAAYAGLDSGSLQVQTNVYGYYPLSESATQGNYSVSIDANKNIIVTLPPDFELSPNNSYQLYFCDAGGNELRALSFGGFDVVAGQIRN